MEVRWNDWNLEHATRHGCSVAEIELVIRRAARPYPRKIGDGKWQIIARGQSDRFVQVVFVIDPANVIYPIHAMPLTTRRRRRNR